MKHILVLGMLWISAGVLCAQEVRTITAPPKVGQAVHYLGNRSPLEPNRLLKLPPGSIRPLGWLRTQCQYLADGLTGRLDEVSDFCKIEGNAWVDPAGMGHSPWEEVPYWLRGLTKLAYDLDDPRLKSKALRWLEPIMRNQRSNGYFGTEQNLQTLDFWPNMLILDALRVHYEATGDIRVITFMSKYFRFQSSIEPNLFLFRSWQKIRGGDNLESIYWLYNRTGERFLLDLAEVNHRNTVVWTNNIPTPHGVNIAQGFKEPAVYYQQSRDPEHLKSPAVLYDVVMGGFGRVPGGMFGADEVVRQGHDGPRQCAETCTMMEFMASHAFLVGLTGETRWAERCEDVAFNSLPASFAPDLKSLRYLTAPNQPVADRKDKAPMINNAGEMFNFRPDYFRCCLHNAGLGWPVFVENLFMATRDGGLAAVLLAPGEVTAKVGTSGEKITLRALTRYPFRDSIRFTVEEGRATRFPLYLRIPSWCRDPRILINGRKIEGKTVPGEWARIERVFQKGDVVELHLPMEVNVRNMDPSRASFSIHRGPLAFSLKIGERWRKHKRVKGWQGWEVFPETPWNVSPAESSLEVVERAFKLNTQVFTPENTPLMLHMKGRRVPSWGLEKNGMVQEIGRVPMTSAEPLEDIWLVPMGCARLRISVFPRLDNE
jgi:hypothetical protein